MYADAWERIFGRWIDSIEEGRCDSAILFFVGFTLYIPSCALGLARVITLDWWLPQLRQRIERRIPAAQRRARELA
ncbi:MAG: hypothetical protein WCT32_02735 [Patescibacteria group bacterium]|jgi:hypothetical protein